jgi:hypothetical protein
MAESVETFYDDLAESYHLMFENWSHSVARQAAIIGPILEQHTGKTSAYVLDCACGIGTQTIGLAQRGHIVVGSAVEIAAKLKDSGILMATIRDYDQLLLTQPTMQAPAFYQQDGKSRFVHQVWQWQGEQYALHVYITVETASGWTVKHFDSRYRALRRSDLNQALQTAGFRDIRWLEPGATSFYQPIVIATKSR